MDKKTGLELLREPFPANQISKLPKGTRIQNECPREQKKICKICGGFHHPDIIHLDYVGHAALTDRLLDADPNWNWEPFTTHEGLPAFDTSGGLWIRLTVAGQTRIGYGHAEKSNFKEIGSREKEVIGDALRNAAMRFGAALDLWHKGELHIEVDEKTSPEAKEHEKTAKTDDVPSSVGAEKPQENEIRLISDKQAKRLFAISRSSGWSDNEVKSYLEGEFCISSSKIIPVDLYEKICKHIEDNKRI